jgi:hypothetical protein
MIEVIDSVSIYWVGGFNDFVNAIKNLITYYLVECSLVVEVKEIVNASEEPLHVGGLCSALVLSVCCCTEPVEEDAKTNCLCHLPEPMLCAAAHHVMVPCACSCLPATLSACPLCPLPAC